MNPLPPLPAWDAAHPLIVHLPIGVLMFAPVLLIVALLDRKRRMTWACAGLVAMAFGTAAAFIAVLSGEAAADHVVGSEAVRHAIHDHEELAEGARTFFAVLTGVLAVLIVLGASAAKKKPLKPIVAIGAVLFAIANAAALVMLANAGHAGGVLVHQLGVHAPIAAEAAPAIDAEHDDD